jgi:hypothetical protein
MTPLRADRVDSSQYSRQSGSRAALLSYPIAMQLRVGWLSREFRGK